MMAGKRDETGFGKAARRPTASSDVYEWTMGIYGREIADACVGIMRILVWDVVMRTCLSTAPRMTWLGACNAIQPHCVRGVVSPDRDKILRFHTDHDPSVLTLCFGIL